MSKKRKSEITVAGQDCIVCDAGSGFMKLGLASELFPSIVAPTIVGRPVVRDHLRYSRHIVSENVANENMLDEYIVLRKEQGPVRSMHPDDKPTSGLVQRIPSGDMYIGKAARDQQSYLDLSRPIERGIVKDWEEMERVFEEYFANLRTSESEQRVLTPSNQRTKRPESNSASSIVLTDMVSTVPGRQREKLLELMFEKFSFERSNISPAAALTLAGKGLSTGLVVDVGDTKTEIVPVVSGFVQKGSVRTSDLGGRTVTNRFIDLLKRGDSANYMLDKERDFFLMEREKENICYVATDLGEERYLADTTPLLTQHLKLPDKTLVANSERFLAPEILFQPGFLGDPDKLGISQLIQDSVQSTAIDLRQGLMRSIVLSGGGTMVPGFVPRLRKDLAMPAIDECATRQFSAYIGGCVMANTASDESNWWIGKKEYQEKGPSACLASRLPN
jgi:actin-related protein 2